MTPEQILEILTKYHEVTKPTGWTLLSQNVAYFSPLITLVSIIIVFFNVNRTQKKNMQNDIKKFKRDLGLKASDELIEEITKIEMCCRTILTVKVTYDQFKDQLDLDLLIEDLENCITAINETTLSMVVVIRKREMVLEKYKEKVLSIFSLGNDVRKHLDIISIYLSGKPNDGYQQTKHLFDYVITRRNEIIELHTKLLKELQDDFFGEIYTQGIKK